MKLVVSYTNQLRLLRGRARAAGEKFGLGIEAILAVRQARPSGDARNHALAVFTHRNLASTVIVVAEPVDAVRQAGVTDAQIVDLTVAVAGIYPTNLFTLISDSTPDFPPAD